ncbi:MAG TPA: metalloregulator ArsR/SmtB family transcription factor [Acidimicrobiales bacterium]|nr:metalloregulator ArsR/SmtB family transcription factor [Acidimicrobiales bacterium]
MSVPRSVVPAAMCCAPITRSPLTPEDAAAASALFAALADPVRLQLFSLVAAHGEVCSCNLEAPLGRSQPTISHHTKVLAEAGLLQGERRGKWTWWTVDHAALESVRKLLGA